MKYFFLFAAVLFLAGCAPTITIGSHRYYVMTEEEEKEMVELARAILVNSKQVTTPAEKLFIKNNKPELKIDYTGDRSGVARVSWMTVDRIISVIYKGNFLAEKMGWVIETQQRMPEVLRFEAPPQTVL